MNTPKAIELALSRVIRAYATLGTGTIVRPWQSLREDPSWDEDQDRAFPLVDIRCSPPVTDDNECNCAAEVSILVGTMADDDKDHAAISALYGAVQECIDSLFSQYRAGTDGDELTMFKEQMSAETESTAFAFGGFTWGTMLAPYDDRGANMIGITLTVHYARSDF